MSNVNKVIVRNEAGEEVSAEDKNSVTLNFPMWFGDKLIDELNDRNITVLVMRKNNGQVFLHLLEADEDISIRVQKAFWRFGGH